MAKPRRLQPRSRKEVMTLARQKTVAEKIKRPGALHQKLGVPQGQKIPAKKLNQAAKEPGLLGQEARFAKNINKNK